MWLFWAERDAEKGSGQLQKKQKLNFALLAIRRHKMIEEYGGVAPKKFMGRIFKGIVRSTSDPWNRRWTRVKHRCNVRDSPSLYTGHQKSAAHNSLENSAHGIFRAPQPYSSIHLATDRPATQIEFLLS